jgi:spore maturation protein CgeB
MVAIEMSDAERAAMARRARERTLEEHTAERRASTLIALIENATAVAGVSVLGG